MWWGERPVAPAPDGTAWTLVASDPGDRRPHPLAVDPGEVDDLYGTPDAAEAQGFLEAWLTAPAPEFDEGAPSGRRRRAQGSGRRSSPTAAGSTESKK